MMKGAIVTNKGMEKIVSREIDSFLEGKKEEHDTVVLFDFQDFHDLARIAYYSRTATRVLYLLAEADVNSLSSISLDGLKPFLKEKRSFAVRCHREGVQEKSSSEIEADIGEVISERLGLDADLDDPDLLVFVQAYDERCYIGLDFAGFDLSKRPYRLFHHTDAMKGTLAFSLLLLSGLGNDKVIVDPFSGSGIIPIEAALYYSGKSCFHYQQADFAFNRYIGDAEELFSQHKRLHADIYSIDSLHKNVRSAEKNAKCAGINKDITFSRMEVEWLDTKFQESSVDSIVTRPPQVSKRVQRTKIKALLEEFFYVSKMILKDSGNIVMIFNDPALLESCLEKRGFRISKRFRMSQGKETVEIFLITKSL